MTAVSCLLFEVLFDVLLQFFKLKSDFLILKFETQISSIKLLQ